LPSVLLLLSSLALFCSPDTSPTAITPLSLHDALPISSQLHRDESCGPLPATVVMPHPAAPRAVNAIARPKTDAFDLLDRATTWRSEEHTSDSSHEWISYAVFCLKKKKKKKTTCSHSRT